jgi:hypothetical protein
MLLAGEQGDATFIKDICMDKPATGCAEVKVTHA